MIDWKKETSKENYCGYCTGYPPSSNCNGTCFDLNGHFPKEHVLKNRKKHSAKMLAEIPNQIGELKNREEGFREELRPEPIKATINIPEKGFNFELLEPVTFDQFVQVGQNVNSPVVEKFPIGNPITLVTSNMPDNLKQEIDRLIAEFCNH